MYIVCARSAIIVELLMLNSAPILPCLAKRYSDCSTLMTKQPIWKVRLDWLLHKTLPPSANPDNTNPTHQSQQCLLQDWGVLRGRAACQ
jgi:hypothetical protein